MLRVRALVKEFYVNLGEQKNLTCYVRGRWILFRERAISQLLELRSVSDCKEYDQLQESSNFEEIVKQLTNGLRVWQRTKTIRNAYIDIGDLLEAVKVWFYFINSVLTLSKHVSTVRQDHAILLYALVNGFNLNVGKIVEQSILDYHENNFSGNIPYSALITLLCLKGGVTFSETKEKCSRSSTLTLIGLKAPVQGEEVERTRKRKRAALQREVTPTAEEELEIEEMGVVLKITQRNQCSPLGLKKI